MLFVGERYGDNCVVWRHVGISFGEVSGIAVKGGRGVKSGQKNSPRIFNWISVDMG